MPQSLSEHELGVTDVVSFDHCQGGTLLKSQLQQLSSRIPFWSRDLSPLAGMPMCSETNQGTPGAGKKWGAALTSRCGQTP